ncbi:MULTISPECIES: carbamoyl-phosphate synthase large subunit [Acidobacterium]|uniref:Carbamoyl phosphate synthase large chain n=1 Tax=Acidobacterium capsulatum (strain ATCC 51196 / DSM 11244 / BCRC 80197 / JCM 7670 / NBRC 15755 / NCIMB 13165 / 161) TaxID=240015 RepID=CARB_ACIC5|nr:MULTISPECIES: carbamoyl-phosphate synthase large subunit [Acidobacterium]C1F1S6.1 RecName: Full=Carbamoyl phosphate synthase large chain; AltName: Full=Carbamoyl phosphate synthetase ammonia chain [Acidobacterium capsulatum ATCC 51196]ACO33826.1 carbamoyl-phosphate synthase, large subunit [Acidobacterium capsulatum ATCC 51196]HCT59999.1 carbamoyl-phosphate synthase large subunit [Acidobacterium sp.]
MPRRNDIRKILVIGSGPIVIGQSAEFDYSGTQACKALKAEGYEVVLVNSNPATIMTDPELADRTYIEPLTVKYLDEILRIEAEMLAASGSNGKFAVLPTVGGQTALNLAVELADAGILDKYGVELIGAKLDAIKKAEDRLLFKDAMTRIGLDVPRSALVNNIRDGLEFATKIGFPVIIRPSFTLGGSGGGIGYNREELMEILARGLDLSPVHECLIEESVLGWKEYELEVMRDLADNVIIICSIENMDPMGVHTGDSITVAPAQTLTDREYQAMRDAALLVMREIGVETGGSNVQFAVNPQTGRMTVIEMNPRVSRSSALASKATGFPIAKIAAKLAVGYTLDEIPNDITRMTPACFEPTIDYVVTKIPKWQFEKFPGADENLGPQMKSVGEVMAIGRTFKESLMKALRSLETGKRVGAEVLEPRRLTQRLVTPQPERLNYVRFAFRQGLSVREVARMTSMDPWFLYQIKEITDTIAAIGDATFDNVSPEQLRKAKRMGISDERLAEVWGLTGNEGVAKVRELRQGHGIRPIYKLVDTCAAEFESATPYFYSSYEEEDEAPQTDKRKVIILGSGPNRIGQGIEFDYCCCHAAFALKEDGFEAIMVNCNPETVSTDYDTSDRLYFEPLTLEDVLAIYEHETANGADAGMIVQFGGQTPLNLALRLKQAGVKIIGTSPESIDLAEDRKSFGKLLEQLQIPQPQGATATSVEEALASAERIGYPVLVRPSYVLGGRAMVIAYDAAAVSHYMKEAVEYSQERPILIDHFLEDAVEVDVDALCDGTDVVIAGIMQHIEEAGIHSGDSSCVLPAVDLAPQVLDTIRDYTRKLALSLKVIGLVNLQFAIQRDKVYVIEVNPRASRTVPYVSKATGVPLAKIASRLMTGRKLSEFLPENIASGKDLGTGAHYYVKSPVFPWNKFPGVDTVLGPEMKSTGEVMGVADNFGEAFAKAQLSAGLILPSSGTVFFSVNDHDKAALVPLAKQYIDLGFQIVATEGTAKVLHKAGIQAESVYKVKEGRPNIVDLIKGQRIQLIINTPRGQDTFFDEQAIRRAAVLQRIPTITTIAAARAAAEGIAASQRKHITVNPLQLLHAGHAVK